MIDLAFIVDDIAVSLGAGLVFLVAIGIRAYRRRRSRKKEDRREARKTEIVKALSDANDRWVRRGTI